MASGLQKLLYLQTVNKVAQEIENHLQISDATVAEFIVETAKESGNVDRFKKAMHEMGLGAALNDVLIERFWSIIQALTGGAGGSGGGGSGVALARPNARLPAAEIVDTRDRAKQLTQELLEEAEQKRRKEEVAAGPSRPPYSGSGDGAGPPGRDPGDGRDGDRRDRYRDDRDRGRGSDRDRDRDRGRDDDRHGRRERSRSRSRERKRRSDQMDMDPRDGGGAGPSGRDRDGFAYPPPPPKRPALPDAPELGGVYRGRVTGTMGTGCFVELINFAKKMEGLVHIANICKKPIQSPTDVVKRGEEVWVKVIGMGSVGANGQQRLSLSMRDVDQATGKDLLPTHLLPGADGEGKLASGLKGMSGIKASVALCKMWRQAAVLNVSRSGWMSGRSAWRSSLFRMWGRMWLDVNTGQHRGCPRSRPYKGLFPGSSRIGKPWVVQRAVNPEDDDPNPRRRGKKLTEYEMWESKQLISSVALCCCDYLNGANLLVQILVTPARLLREGVLDVREYAHYDEDSGLGVLASATDPSEAEEFEIDLNEMEPQFLKGAGTRSGIEMSPVKIVKNPDGSLQRAAMTQSALAKERRELKEQQQRTLLEAIPKDLSRPWEDPMADPSERALAQELRGIGLTQSEVPEWKKAAMGKAISYGIQDARSIKEQRESLPIFKLKQQLIEAVRDNQVLVVIGETGSGKTTQMTQYLAEAGYTAGGKIGCTQPRRVAAMSVAKRVAEEFGCRLGEEVGYAIRFEDCTGPETVIKYMTDGMLLRECLLDEALSQYSVVVLDEAHERTIHTDVLFGLMKEGGVRSSQPAAREGVGAHMWPVCRKRTDFKLIVTSATLDAEKFSSYFFDAPIFTIPGRTYPVEVLYTKAPEPDYLDAALITVLQIHLSEPEGDLLLFLTGQEEIETACQILYERIKALGPAVPELIVLPVFSALPSEIQTRIFEPAPPGKRKCVVATNIAEASLTIDGIYYVVDPGFAKMKVFNPKNGMDSLVVAPISQASAKQRAGRAGRTGPGKCYRLYTEAAYKNEMLPLSVPEIQRTNLAMTVLTLKAMGINDLLGFDFMDPPPASTLISALEQLYNLGALDEEGLLTKLGRKMAEFPLEPPMSKVLIASVDLGCSEEILTILAMLSAQNIFYRPREKQAQGPAGCVTPLPVVFVVLIILSLGFGVGTADQRKAKFYQPEGDHLTLLAVYEQWKANKFSVPWCKENFIQDRSMKRAQDVRKQLLAIMDRYKLEQVSAGRNYTKICKAITSGFFFHTARKDPQEGYKTVVEQQPVYIHPSSSLFQQQPDWVLYHELILTTKEYMREVLAIDPRWLPELAPRFFKPADPNKLSRRKRFERIEPLYDRYNDPNAWRLSRRRG
ncbi:hypothetical protein VOLCADRAFT_104170 [Volvox carteri f. nagariensis]|uniref:RNA helicase n=1 Tax=Volvox carteri f. nagariensis TaxID=3068 RepID=D8TRX0_VOLCA|nr:uncharacterized protein VOLCADRAFT_104170 [Volvox carteri f. nagariensis]EFJ49720.1 hypothetical protein VOLCADRAFT_104170 [Volvox carteri f. nagariensis]|eukprot:XP_002949227.1 hypothetical protein VOLCADRAFT_104170 [Volvox carteri f. nagariensis]